MFTMKTVKLFLWLSVLVNVGYSRSAPVGRIDSGDVKGDLEGMGSRQKEEASGTDGDKGQGQGQGHGNSRNQRSSPYDRAVVKSIVEEVEKIAREEEEINPSLPEDRAEAVNNIRQEIERIAIEQRRFKENGGVLEEDKSKLERDPIVFVPLYRRPPGNFTRVLRPKKVKKSTTTTSTTTTTTKRTTTSPPTTTPPTTTPTTTTPTITPTTTTPTTTTTSTTTTTTTPETMTSTNTTATTTTTTTTTPTTTTPTTPTTTTPTTTTRTTTTPTTTTPTITTPTTTTPTTTTSTTTTPTTTTPVTTTKKRSRSRGNNDVVIAVEKSSTTASPNGEIDEDPSGRRKRARRLAGIGRETTT